MPIRRRRRKDKPNASPSSDVGGVRVDGSELHVGRDLIGRDNVQIGSQHTYHLGAAGLAAIVAVVGLFTVAIVAVVVGRWPDDGGPTAGSGPVASVPTALPTSPALPAVAGTAAPVPTTAPTLPPTAAPTVAPTTVPSATPAPTPRPVPMLGRYANVLIAPFGELDGSGNAIDWPIGPRLAVAIHRELEQALDPLIQRGDVKLRYEGVERVAGANPDQRGQLAQRLVDAHKATLLVFGNLQRAEGRSLLMPELLAGKSDFGEPRSHLDGAEEIVGRDRLRIPVGDPNAASAPDEIAQRVLTLVHFTTGLTYLQAADSARANPTEPVPGGKDESYYDKAIAAFDRAEAALQADSRGLEVIHLFRGIAYQRIRGTGYSAEEAREYQKALDVNPEYARAYLGLGYNKLLQYMYEGTFLSEKTGEYVNNLSILADAEKLIRRASTARDKPPEAQVDLKIKLALATIKLVEAQDIDPGKFAEAEAGFKEIVRQYEAGDSKLEYLVGFAHFGLGAIYEVRDGDPAAARVMYQKVLSQKSPPREIEIKSKERMDRIDGKSYMGEPTGIPWSRPERLLPTVPAYGKG